MSAELLEDFRNLTYFDMAATTIYVWDYLLTFGMEVEVVWKSKWNLMKVIFLVQRYLPFVDTVWLTLYSEVVMGLSPANCHTYVVTAAVSMDIGYATSQIILAMRTWAVWNCNRRLLIILSIFYILCGGSVISVLLTSIAGFKFAPNLPPAIHGCIPVKVDNHLFIAWVLLFVWDAMMFGFMLVSGIHTYRAGAHSGLTNVVYRDGLIYYIYLLILSIANIIFSQVLPTPYQKLLVSMERVLLSLLASRVLLHMRSYSPESYWTRDGNLDFLVGTE